MQTMRITGHDGILSIWKGPETGVAADAFVVAKDGVRQAEGFYIAARNIAADPMLSDAGKIEPTLVQAKGRLAAIDKLRKQVDTALAGVTARQSSMLDIPAADVPATMLDCELGRWMRTELGDRERFSIVEGSKLGTTEERVTSAIIRLPSALSGVAPEQRAKIVEEVTRRSNPELAEQLADSAAAWTNAGEVLNECAQFIAHGAPVKRGGRSIIPGLVEEQPNSVVAKFRQAEAAAANAA